MSDQSHSGEGIPEKKESQASGKPHSEPETTETPSAVSSTKSNPAPSIGHNCKKTYKCVKEEIKYWFELGGIIAGIGVLYLLYLQYGEMVKTTNIAVGQLKAMQAQSEVMQGQLGEMQRTRQLDERAWVGVSELIAEYNGDPNRTVISVQFKNTGKTPAINVMTFVDGGSSIDFPGGVDMMKAANISNMYRFSGLLAPDAVAGISTSEQPLSLTEVNGIEKGAPYFVKGKIWYGDIFGREHWTQFCYKIVFSPKFNAFPISTNSCDDAQADQSN